MILRVLDHGSITGKWGRFKSTPHEDHIPNMKGLLSIYMDVEESMSMSLITK